MQHWIITANGIPKKREAITRFLDKTYPERRAERVLSWSEWLDRAGKVEYGRVVDGVANEASVPYPYVINGVTEYGVHKLVAGPLHHFITTRITEDRPTLFIGINPHTLCEAINADSLYNVVQGHYTIRKEKVQK